MLSDLVVEGLGVIDRAELSLDRGCSALTGETGAGKTLVVAALSLLLGGRADRTLVREGASEARVEGRFVLPSTHEAVRLLRAHGLVEETDPGMVEIVVSRTVPPGKASGRARINGRLTTVSFLSELGVLLGEIAGQQDHQRLSDPAFQRSLLNAFSGEEAVALASELAAAVRGARAATRRAEELRNNERERSRELDVLAFEVAEIEGAGLRQGERAELAERSARLEHAEEIARGIAEASSILRGERGIDEQLSAARSAIACLIGRDPELTPLVQRLDDASYELADIAEELVARKVEPDPVVLDEVRGRLEVIGRLVRKYGEDESDVLRYLELSRERMRELDAFEIDLKEAEELSHLGMERAIALAERLSRMRREAAPVLAKKVEALLGSLAMPQARFDVSLKSRPLGQGGLEDVEFRVAADPGAEPRPVAKVASGGELSRIALALHVLVSPDDAETVVFDEVDSGIGGEAGQAVGSALAALARDSGGQVIVVTHLPQVAAFADSHFRVSKSAVAGRTVAALERVKGEQRIGELSRMLAGLPRSEWAREHAQELLDLAASRVGAA
jgi:DNA repair protein RecN (Recombination protein N)